MIESHFQDNLSCRSELGITLGGCHYSFTGRANTIKLHMHNIRRSATFSLSSSDTLSLEVPWLKASKNIFLADSIFFFIIKNINMTGERKTFFPSIFIVIIKNSVFGLIPISSYWIFL